MSVFSCAKCGFETSIGGGVPHTCKKLLQHGRTKTCGCKRAGIGVFNDTEIQRCDDCNLFETDDDAANAVDHLLRLLGKVYDSNPELTVADAFDVMENLVKTHLKRTKAGR